MGRFEFGAGYNCGRMHAAKYSYEICAAASSSFCMKNLLVLVVFSLLFSCNQNTKSSLPDKDFEGSMRIMVDENYRDVMSEQVEVFTAQYPKAQIEVEYANEVECIEALLDSTVRMIFVTRPLSIPESQYAKQQKLFISYGDLAKDGIALLCAKNAAKKNFKKQEIEKIFSAEEKSYQVVFESSNSGDTRYFADSVLKGAQMNTNIFSAGSPDKLVDYISQNENSIGVMGMYIILEHEKKVKSYLNKIDVIGVKTESSEYYWQPYPLYVASQDYPYTKKLYFILSESWQGLGHSFANYLSREQGQLLFSKFNLFPLKYNIIKRSVKIESER